MLHCSSSCLFVNKVLVKKSIIGWLPHLKIFRYSCLILYIAYVEKLSFTEGSSTVKQYHKHSRSILEWFFSTFVKPKGIFLNILPFQWKVFGNSFTNFHQWSCRLVSMTGTQITMSRAYMGATPSKVEKGATNGEGAPPYKHDKLAPLVRPFFVFFDEVRYRVFFKYCVFP